MKLSVGMATYGTFEEIYFTLQSLRMYHSNVEFEILVVDNQGNDNLKDWMSAWGVGKYYRYTDIQGTTQPRQKVFEYAEGEFVICIDSHVMIAPGALKRTIEWLPDYQGDLIHGPMIYDDMHTVTTHMDDQWRDNMWGTWAEATHAVDLPKEPWEIPMHGLGLFACGKKDWLGFNGGFKGFGGEEGYIHAKFRKAGKKVLCLPWLLWVHKFSTIGGVQYPVRTQDRVRNYVLGAQELGLPIDPIIQHFGSRMVAPYVSYNDSKGTV